MFNLILILLLIFVSFNILILYINAIREDFNKPKLLDLNEFYFKNIK
jgi:hypothetical protein